MMGSMIRRRPIGQRRRLNGRGNGAMSDITIHQSKYGDDPCNFHIAKLVDELQVELIYPPHTSRKDGGGKCKYVFVNQESARATDGVRLWYDYNRDGWVIEQASTFQWADD